MTIKRGEPWGRVGQAPADLVTVTNDAQLGELVTQYRRTDRSLPPVALLGGDLMRAVGGTGDAARLDREVSIMTVDVVRVRARDVTAWFVAHLVGRGGGWSGWWRGEVVAAMNAQHLSIQHGGTWDVAPRSHPNDGRVDVVRVRAAMSVRDRWRARSRVVHGAHLPHPQIEVRATPSVTLELDRPLQWWLDGRAWTTAASVELTVEPDALTVCV